MNITPNYDLIPYPDHDYQLKPYVRQKLVAKQNCGQEPITGHGRYRQPDSNIYTIHIEVQNHTYGVGQKPAYLHIHQVGRLIDIYA